MLLVVGLGLGVAAALLRLRLRLLRLLALSIGMSLWPCATITPAWWHIYWRHRHPRTGTSPALMAAILPVAGGSSTGGGAVRVLAGRTS
eukprot:COSAG05_NODE_2307_length_3247_cov_15.723316_3_plen_89_part_00